jgi:hypothetical protein
MYAATAVMLHAIGYATSFERRHPLLATPQSHHLHCWREE